MAEKYDFSGVWRSTYRLRSGLGKGMLETDHYVTMNLKGNQLVLESIPNVEESYMVARFSLDGRVATGSYQSQNSPQSSVKGALYYGAAQLILDEDGRALRGKGVGFGRGMVVKASDWELVRIGQKMPRKDETVAHRHIDENETAQ